MYGFVVGHVSGMLQERDAPHGIAARPDRTTEWKNGK